jgi:hypothetical protein
MRPGDWRFQYVTNASFTVTLWQNQTGIEKGMEEDGCSWQWRTSSNNVYRYQDYPPLIFRVDTGLVFGLTIRGSPAVCGFI